MPEKRNPRPDPGAQMVLAGLADNQSAATTRFADYRLPRVLDAGS